MYLFYVARTSLQLSIHQAVHHKATYKGNPLLSPNWVWLTILGRVKRHQGAASSLPWLTVQAGGHEGHCFTKTKARPNPYHTHGHSKVSQNVSLSILCHLLCGTVLSHQGHCPPFSLVSLNPLHASSCTA